MEETRTCTICGQTKALEKFQKSKRSKGGRRNQCTQCRNAHAKAKYTPEEWRARCRAYFATPSGKAARAKGNKKWRQGEKGKAYQSRPDVRARLNEKMRRYRERNPLKAAARDAVRSAKNTGKLARPTTLACARCGEPASGYHHHKGYAPEHHLDVVPLCRPCHRDAEGDPC